MARGAIVTLFSQIANGVVANTVQERTITAAGVGSLIIPARFLEVGTSIRILVRGAWTIQATPNVSWRVKLGTTVVCDTGIQTSPSGGSGAISIEAVVVCRTAGAAGSVIAAGSVANPKGRFDFAVQTTALPIDTTVPLPLDILVQWATAHANNVVTATALVVWAEQPI